VKTIDSGVSAFDRSRADILDNLRRATANYEGASHDLAQAERDGSNSNFVQSLRPGVERAKSLVEKLTAEAKSSK
jgi:hypothetical protein